MKKSNVKKLLTIAVIVLSAITCFAVVNGTMFASNARETEQVLDLGLEYKDGWYLINDAEDYYIMTSLTSTGEANGAKFRQTKDLTVDPRRANTAVFSNATFDGGGYKLNMELAPTYQLDPTYEPEIDARGVKIDIANIATEEATGWAGEIYKSQVTHQVQNSWTGEQYTREVWSFSATTAVSASGPKYTIESNANIERNYLTINLANYGGYEIAGSLAVGGVFGVLYNSNVSNIYITLDASISFTGSPFSDHACYFGGLVGVAYNSNISYCVVEYGTAPNLVDVDYCGSLVGDAVGGTIEKNIVMGSSGMTRIIGGNGEYLDGSGTTTDRYNYAKAAYAFTGDSGLHTLDGFNNGEVYYGGEHNGKLTGANWNSSGKYKWVTDVPYVNGGKPIQACFVDVDFITITADANGGTINSFGDWSGNSSKATKTIAKGEMIESLPGVADREGYTFLGWGLTSTAATGLPTSWVPTRTTTIYAIWLEDILDYELTLDANGGSIADDYFVGSDYVEFIKTATGGKLKYSYFPNDIDEFYLPDETEVSKWSAPTHYTFGGWEISVGGGEWKKGETFTGDDLYDKIKVRKGNATFKVIWTPIPYTVSLYGAETINHSDATYNDDKKCFEMNFTYDNALTLPTASHVTKDDHRFMGWLIKTDVSTVKKVTSNNYVTVIQSGSYGSGFALMADWDEEYTITLDANGGTINGLSQYEYEYCGELESGITFGTPVRPGFTFAGWELVSSDISVIKLAYGSYAGGVQYYVGVYSGATGDAVFRAKWERAIYILNLSFTEGEPKFKSNGTTEYYPAQCYLYGGYNNRNITIYYYYEHSFNLPTADEVTCAGKKLTGWKVVDGTGLSGTLSPGYEIRNCTANVTLEPVWGYDMLYLELDGGDLTYEEQIEDFTYLVHFSAATYNESAKRIEISNPSSISSLRLPYASEVYKDGYTLDCWDVIKNGVAVDSLHPGDSLTGYTGTLRARWKANIYTYTVTANANGGTITGGTGWRGMGDYAQKEVTYGAEYGSLPTVTAPDDWMFIGWAFEDGNEVTEDTLVEIAGNHDIYAQFEPIIYTLTIDPAGGDWSGETKAFGSCGERYTIEGEPTKDGYNFIGWGIDDNDPGILEGAIYTFGSGDGTVTAQFEPIEYTLTLNLNPNNISGELSNTYNIGQYDSINKIITITYTIETAAFNLPTSTHIKLTYKNLNKWICQSGEGSWTASEYACGATIVGMYGKVTLIADWADTNLQVTADAGTNGGKISSVSGDWTKESDTIATNSNITAGGTYGTLPTEEDRTGYTFLGWFTAASGGTKVEANTVVTNTEAHTIYARWEKITYKITLNLNGFTYNGSSDTVEIEYNIENGATLPSNLEHNYKELIQWTLDASNSGTHGGWEDSYSPGASITGAWGNVTLNALGALKDFNITIREEGEETDTLTYKTSEDSEQSKTLPIVDMIGYNTVITIAAGTVNQSASIDGKSLIIPQYSYGDIIVDVRWEGTWNDIVLNGGGGTFTAANGWTLSNSGATATTQYQTKVSNQTVNLIEPTRDQWIFNGWDVSDLPSGVSLSGNSLTIPANVSETITLTALWKDADSHTIYIVKEPNGSQEVFDTYKTSVSAQTFTLPALTQPGYTRQDPAWEITTNSSGGKSTVSGNVLTIPANESGQIVITAKWTLINYTLTLNLNGGENKGYGKGTTITYNIETAAFNLPTSTEITKTYKTLSKWICQSGEGSWTASEYACGATIVGMYGNVTLIADWVDINLQVTANANGGKISIVSGDWTKKSDMIATNSNITAGGTYGTLPTVEDRTGYTFKGWYTAVNGGTKVEDTTEVTNTAAHTIYAQWEPIKYTVVFDKNANDATGTMPNQEFEYDVAQKLRKNTYVRTNWSFAGWSRSSTATSAEYADEASVSNLTSTPNGTVILYAKWSQTEFTITADAGTNGGTIKDANGWDGTVGSTSVTKTIDSATTKPFETLPEVNDRDGYTFSGWYTATSGGTRVTTETTTIYTSIYAQWTPIPYKITYYDDDGITPFEFDKKYTEYDIETSITLPTPSKTGQAFTGWMLRTCDGEWGGTGIYLGGTQTPSGAYGDVELQAIWFATTVTIAANANGGTIANVNSWSGTTGSTSVTKTVEKTATKPYATLPTAVRAGYTFVGWYTIPETSGGTKIEDSTQNLIKEEAHTIYARWSATPYTITYQDASGNKITYSSSYCYYDIETQITLAPAPTSIPTGKQFGGWSYYSGADGTAWVDKEGLTKSPSGAYGNVTLRPKWDIKQTTLTINPNGGTWNGYSSSVIYTNGYGYELEIADAERSGFNFIGWECSESTYWNSSSKTYTFGDNSATLTATWEAKEYTITLNGNGGNFSGVSTITLTYSTSSADDGVSKDLTVPTRTGYTHTGWNISQNTSFANSTVEGNTLKIPKYAYGNITLTALWQANPLTIILVLNGGAIDTTTYTLGQDIGNGNWGINAYASDEVTLPNETQTLKDKYNFVGWELDSKDGTVELEVVDGYVVKVKQNSCGLVTLVAKWTPKPLNITLKLNNGTIDTNKYKVALVDGADSDTKVINANSETGNIALPTSVAFQITRDKYDFLGWKVIGTRPSTINLSPNNDTTYVAGIMTGSHGNITLEAIWRAKQLIITLKLNGGEIDAAKYEVTINNGADADTKVIFATIFTPGVPLPLVNNNIIQVSRVAYTFLGWKVVGTPDSTITTSPSDQTQYINSIVSGSYGSITLEACWQVITYQIKLTTGELGDLYYYKPYAELNSGEVDTYTFDYHIETTEFILPKPEDMFSNTHDLIGWTLTSTDSVTSWTNSEYTNLPYKVVGMYGNVELAAKWQPRPFTITLKLNGVEALGPKIENFTLSGTKILADNYDATTLKITYTVESAFTLPTKDHVKQTAYTFAGWAWRFNTNGNDSALTTDDNDYLTEVGVGTWGNMTLEAQWTADEYEITFSTTPLGILKDYKPLTYDSGTSSVFKFTYTYESKFNLPTYDEVFSNTHDIQSWKPIASNGSWEIKDYALGDAVGIGSENIGPMYGHISLYAQWETRKFTITINLAGVEALNPKIENYSLTGIANKQGDYDGSALTIKYTVDSAFTLPTKAHVKQTAYTFAGWAWQFDTEGEDEHLTLDDGYVTAIGEGTWGDMTLEAQWTADKYNLTLSTSGESSNGKLKNYEPLPDQNGDGLDFFTITYTYESVFNLPTDGEVHSNTHYLVKWLRVGDGANTSWSSANYANGATIQNMYGNITLSADWDWKEFTLTLNPDELVPEKFTPELGGQIADYMPSGIANDKITIDGHKYLITFTANMAFDLPTADHTTKFAYEFEGWKVDYMAGEGQFDPNNETTYKTGIKKGTWGDLTLVAVWKPTSFTVTLDTNTGSIGDSYNPAGYNKELLTIVYNIESAPFNLPLFAEMTKERYRVIAWNLVVPEGAVHNWEDKYEYDLSNRTQPITIATGHYGSVTLQAEWEKIVFDITIKANGGVFVEGTPNIKPDSHNTIIETTYTYEIPFSLPAKTDTYLKGYTTTKWIVESVVDDLGWGEGNEYIPGFSFSDKKGDVVLNAYWTENRYNIVLNANNRTGYSESKDGVWFTEVVALDWYVPTYNNHIFIGWAMTGYNTTQTYEYLANNCTENDIVETFGNAILEYGNPEATKYGRVSQLSEGDEYSNTDVHIYAIWQPVYIVSIVRGERDATFDVSTPKIYNNGTATNDLSFTVNNHYYSGYDLYQQYKTELFNEPTSTYGQYRLFRYGYSIEGWVIKVGATQYYVKSGASTPPAYYDWDIVTAAMAEQGTYFVASGINLRYLQGNITATPQWKALEIDVTYVVKSTEAYKQPYNSYSETTTVIFDSNYIISATEVVATGYTRVEAEDISAYTVIYAHPYAEEQVDTAITIEVQSRWNYHLDYKESNGGRWVVTIEGYYAPDLYRLYIDLQLPYSVTEQLNNNGYTLDESKSMDDLLDRYGAKTIDKSGKYIDSANYTERQGKIYKVDGHYYIYLLQDQKIEEQQVYDIYLNGKDYDDPTGLELPNFEIPYYQMQYYYTVNDLSNIKLYQMAELDSDHIAEAKTKLKIGQNEIDYANNWLYEYCNTNEILGEFALKVYWYRNVINVALNNLLDSKRTFNGYSMLIEYEQVTASLQEHFKYNLVICTYDNEVYRYVTYSFNDESILKIDGKYNYLQLASKTDEELRALGITKTEANTIEVFFGNRIEVKAVDQSKDHSKDEFVGYRFDDYDYFTFDKTSAATKVEIAELDDYSNDYVNYTVSVDLQDYEHELDGNTDNYFNDKDKLSINVIFDRIEYTLNYRVTDDSNTPDEKYGTIKFSYMQASIERAQFAYKLTIDNTNNLKAEMRLRLGSELLEWRIVNPYITSKQLTENQLCEILLNAEFLRENLYLCLTDEALTHYSAQPEQTIGDINAVCGDIDFRIDVKVKLLTEDTNIREYTLTDEEDNKLFVVKQSGSNVNVVSIDNDYTIEMLTKQDGDTYLYYYQDGQAYAVRSLYLGYSLAHSTNLLVTEFGYPVTSLPNIAMVVNHSLLDGSVNYAQYIEVSEENRQLVFYVEVSPIVELEIEINPHEYDRNQGARTLSINDVVIASANSGNALQVGENYLGYVGQEILMTFVGDTNYYASALLEVLIGEDPARELQIAVNSNIQYIIVDAAKIKVQLTPKVYAVEAKIVYNNQEFSTNDYASVVNASGEKIFAAVNGVQIDSVAGNIDPTSGKYYYGDKLHIQYAFNELLASDFSITIYVNNSILYQDDAFKYIAQFTGSDLDIRLEVLAKTKTVTLATSIANQHIADIFVQINDGAVEVMQNSETTTPKELTLINGDQLTVYIKAEVGYRFTGKYEYSNVKTPVTTTAGTDDFEGYIKFKILEDGFELSKAGWYYLIFEQIPIEIEFKYYTISPNVEEDNNAVQTGKEYTSTSDDTVLKQGSKVMLTRGQDAPGYRFEKYTYRQADGTEFILTEVNENQVEFEISGDVVDYLEEAEIVDSKITLVVYVNYVRQYQVHYEYICNPDLVHIQLHDKAGNPLQQLVYYDYGTEMEIDIQTSDTAHYSVTATIAVGTPPVGEETDTRTIEIISTSTKDSVELVSGSIKSTNLGKLAGFKADRVLTDTYTITLNANVEMYDTQLTQSLKNDVSSAAEQESAGLIGQTDDFQLVENIYYKVGAGVTHEYGSAVQMEIYVLIPPEEVDTTKQYYVITGATLNGEDIEVGGLKTRTVGEYNGHAFNVYTITYLLSGEELPTTQELEIKFSAVYYVSLEQPEQANNS